MPTPGPENNRSILVLRKPRKVDGPVFPVVILGSHCPKMTRAATGFTCARISEV